MAMATMVGVRRNKLFTVTVGNVCSATGIVRTTANQRSFSNVLFELMGLPEFKAESNLCHLQYREINRTLSDISGKGSKNHHLEGLNFHIHPEKNTSLPVVYVKQEHIVNDVYRGKVTGKIYLYNKGKISYNGVYKALVKIAVDMIPSAQIAHFKDTGRWVHGDIDGAYLPTFLYGEHQDFFEQPVLDFFFRKEDSPAFSPYCTAILYIFDSVFIYALPYSDMDDAGFATGSSLVKHWAFFRQYQYLNVEEWAELDSNDQTLLIPYYKIPTMGGNQKYRLECRPSTEEVFRRKR